MTNNEIITGGCMCGSVQYAISGDKIGVVNCHCKQCQRLHGNYNPMLVGEKANLIITKGDKDLTVFNSSESAQRCFCSKCGSQLFKQQTNGPKVMLSIGGLDESSDYHSIKNIFTETAGQYYEMPIVEN
jgi:hypothetical protein